MKKILLLAATTAILSACGGGSNSSNSGTTEPQTDAFTAKVLDMAASTPDGNEPTSVDTLTATAPEDTQPTPII